MNYLSDEDHFNDFNIIGLFKKRTVIKNEIVDSFPPDCKSFVHNKNLAKLLGVKCRKRRPFLKKSDVLYVVWVDDLRLPGLNRCYSSQEIPDGTVSLSDYKKLSVVKEYVIK